MPTVAEQLRIAREAHGLTIHQVAEITKIKTEHVRALEAGDYSAFAAPVYIRGFIRTYARLVRLDPEDLMAAVETELASTGSFEETNPAAPRNRGILDALMLAFSKVNWRVVLPVLVVAVVLVGMILGYRLYAARKNEDPLLRLGSGQYEPVQPDPVEMLPLPSTNRP